jgi:hypothetical protein
VQTPEGAVAFVRFYVDQINRAWTEPNDGTLRPNSTSECLSCAALQETAASLVSTGERFAGPPLQLDSITPRDGAPPGQQFVSAQMQQLASSRVDGSGQVKESQSQASAVRDFVVIWQESRWLMHGIS